MADQENEGDVLSAEWAAYFISCRNRSQILYILSISFRIFYILATKCYMLSKVAYPAYYSTF